MVARFQCEGTKGHEIILTDNLVNIDIDRLLVIDILIVYRVWFNIQVLSTSECQRDFVSSGMISRIISNVCPHF